MIVQMRNVVLTPGEEVVDDDNVAAPGDQGIGKVRTDESGATG